MVVSPCLLSGSTTSLRERMSSLRDSFMSSPSQHTDGIDGLQFCYSPEGSMYGLVELYN